MGVVNTYSVLIQQLVGTLQGKWLWIRENPKNIRKK